MGRPEHGSTAGHLCPPGAVPEEHPGHHGHVQFTDCEEGVAAGNPGGNTHQAVVPECGHRAEL